MTIDELFRTYGSFTICIAMGLEFLRRLDSGKLVTGKQHDKLANDLKTVTEEAKELAKELKASQDAERARLQTQIDTLTKTVEEMAKKLPQGGE